MPMLAIVLTNRVERNDIIPTYRAGPVEESVRICFSTILGEPGCFTQDFS